MGTEPGILGLYGLLCLLTILVQAMAAHTQVGTALLLSDRSEMPKLTGMAGRLDRAQANSVVALALVAPAVLSLAQKGVTGGSTLLAAQVFLAMRVVYVFSYAFKINGIRSLAWSIGFFATAWLYLAGLTG